MYLTSPPFWILPFNKRNVGVALHTIRGLILLDPKGQRNLPSDRIRLYVANENAIYILYWKHSKIHLQLPYSEKQAWLTVRAYGAFLNPSLRRPNQFLPKQTESWFDLVKAEGFEDKEHETGLIYHEILEDQEAWTRSEEEGWFYDD